jgi:hypothetical protein
MGLAEPASPSQWLVRKDFESTLRTMQQANDRQKMLARCSALISDPRLPMQFTPTWRIRLLEGRVLGHLLDDATGKVQMLLEGTDAQVHFIPHDDAIREARSHGLLKPSHVVSLTGQRGRISIRPLVQRGIIDSGARDR